MILELPFAELELDDVIREPSDKGLVDRTELISTEKTAFEVGVFVCLTHLLKFEALGKQSKSSKKIEYSRR